MSPNNKKPKLDHLNSFLGKQPKKSWKDNILNLFKARKAKFHQEYKIYYRPYLINFRRGAPFILFVSVACFISFCLENTRSDLQLKVRKEKTLKDREIEKEDNYMKSLINGQQAVEEFKNEPIVEFSTSTRYKHELFPDAIQEMTEDYEKDDDY